MALKTENTFHQVLAQAKRRPRGETWGVCVSGGLDSISLLYLLSACARITGHRVEVFHVCHGELRDDNQSKFRKEALRLVHEVCLSLSLPLHMNVDLDGKLRPGLPAFPDKSSEAKLRDFRWQSVQFLSRGLSQPLVYLTGHHHDDVLETRLIQLVRGVGAEAFVRFQAESPGIWRPLYLIRREELVSLGVRQKWSWVDDPSNVDRGPLRNWIRHEWLPSLENKRKGGAKTLSRSLENLVQALSPSRLDAFSVDSVVEGERISRSIFVGLNRERQIQALTHLIQRQGVTNYTQGQLFEILKRVNRNTNEMKFEICKLCWEIDKFYIQASRV